MADDSDGEQQNLGLTDTNDEVNPYGIEGEFVPVAVFDTENEEVPPDDADDEADDDLFGSGPSGVQDDDDEEEEEEEEEEDEEEEERYGGEGIEEEEYYDEFDEHIDYLTLLLEEELSDEADMYEGGEGGEEGEERGDEEEGEAKVQFEKKEEKKPKEDMRKRRMSTRRMSMAIRKQSIFYREQARFDEFGDKRVSGDFTAMRPDEIGDDRSLPSIASYQLDSDEYSYVTIEEEQEKEPIDREHYYNIYRETLPKRNFHRMKNNLLQRKMADYFKKRKMEHVLKESDNLVDSQQKYDKKLDALGDLINMDTRERNSISSELEDLRAQRDDQLQMLNISFDKMQNREKEIGTGLINTKTAKEIPEKVVERFLKRQRSKWAEVACMRLAYIKIRNRVSEKKVALHALDCIGDNLHLIDFEQLKIEHQSHTDKIEERDEELTNLRRKCKGAIQCLAHVREKSAAVQIDMIMLQERFEEIEMECHECRERLNYYKQERDNYRFQTEKLQDEAGVLGKPKLCVDMEDSMEEVQRRTHELENLKRENKEIKESLKALKSNISSLASSKMKEARKTPVLQQAKSRRIYKGRPTMVFPDLPESDWSVLMK